MSVQYTGGIAVHYECSVHRGISLNTPGDIMSTLRVISTMGIHDEREGYYDECREIL